MTSTTFESLALCYCSPCQNGGLLSYNLDLTTQPTKSNPKPSCICACKSGFDGIYCENNIVTAGTAAPDKWMATRTGRSYNEAGKRVADWGASAQNIEDAEANLQCCELRPNFGAKTIRGIRKVHGECNRDAAGVVHDGGMTWIQAYNACKDGGLRLCTDAEVFSEIGGDAGCNFDNVRLWTSTPWSEVPEAARKGATATGDVGCPSGYTSSRSPECA